MNLKETHPLYTSALKTLLGDMLRQIKTGSHCQSVAIRLFKEGDFPYHSQMGFPDFFILRENNLTVRDSEDKTVIDDDGTPFLECMCGNVLKNRFNPTRSYFTKSGVFWTNSTTQLLGSFTDEEKREVGKTRNTCHDFGYESVALIPIHSNNKTIGLIQMNDPRENMFTVEEIEKLQLMADKVGIIMENIFGFYEDANDLSG